MIARFMSFINRVLQSGIRAISTVGRSLDRTGRVLGLLLSALSAEAILLLYSLNSKIFTRLALISLYKIVSVDSGLE